MTSTCDRGIAAALVATDAVFLRFGRPDLLLLVTNLAHPHRWVANAGSDGAAATLAQTGLWLCAVWIAVAVSSVAASRLPGAAGTLAAALARRAVPAVIGRSIAGVVGASIFLAPLAAGAATPHRAAVPVATSASVSVTTAGSRTPDLDDAGSWAWPTSPERSSGAPVSHAPPHADGDPVAVPVPWPLSRPHDLPKRSAPREVIVRRGDSLWAIAAQRLGPQADAHQISTASKQWYEANKPTIGSDPRLIQPGQHLHEPTEKGHRS